MKAAGWAGWAGCLAGWLAGWLAGLAGWLACWLAGWTDWAGWFAALLAGLAGWPGLPACLADWLAELFFPARETHVKRRTCKNSDSVREGTHKLARHVKKKRLEFMHVKLCMSGHFSFILVVKLIRNWNLSGRTVASYCNPIKYHPYLEITKKTSKFDV